MFPIETIGPSKKEKKKHIDFDQSDSESEQYPSFGPSSRSAIRTLDNVYN